MKNTNKLYHIVIIFQPGSACPGFKISGPITAFFLFRSSILFLKAVLTSAVLSVHKKTDLQLSTYFCNFDLLRSDDPNLGCVKIFPLIYRSRPLLDSYTIIKRWRFVYVIKYLKNFSVEILSFALFTIYNDVSTSVVRLHSIFHSICDFLRCYSCCTIPLDLKWNEIKFFYPGHMIRNWHWCVWDESCQSGSPSKKLQRKKYWIRFYDRKKLYFYNIDIYLYWYNIIVIFSFINQQITLIFR